MRILGIDPGLQRAGWGVIEKHGNRLSFIAAGVISTSRVGDGLAARLQCLHEGVQEIIARYQPDQAAMEETFVNVNGASTMKLGQARGALLLSLTLTGLYVHEYAATHIKKTITGAGRADKEQIMRMLQFLLPGVNITQPDAADAVAVALCHAQHTKLNQALAQNS